MSSSSSVIAVNGLSKYFQVPTRKSGLKAAGKSLFKRTYCTVKAVDRQVRVSVREFRFWSLTDALAGLAVLLMALARFVWRQSMRRYSQWPRPKVLPGFQR